MLYLLHLNNMLFHLHRRRGDGFALAAMLTHISIDNRDIHPVLAGHIYTVCPAAVPRLPTRSSNLSEDSFMESLGMAKEADGSFESFERFILRTEVRTSIRLAEIICTPLLGSHSHCLFF
jgi:GLE1-like protein